MRVSNSGYRSKEGFLRRVRTDRNDFLWVRASGVFSLGKQRSSSNNMALFIFECQILFPMVVSGLKESTDEDM